MYRLYTTKVINAISLICTIIVFSFICFINMQIRDFSKTPNFPSNKKEAVKVQFNDSKEKNVLQEEINVTEDVWYLKIPTISLNAKIAEGTTQETLNSAIGHFENTSKTSGNIGLAAHNRGYSVNYFENIKLLKKGDKIQYVYKEFEKEYAVIDNIIIKDTDWTKLENTEENTITLITCVEGEKEFRRCVIGKEI